jgi:hypothetical protein
LSAFAAPPPRVIAPPVEAQVFEDHPEKIELDAPRLMPPPLVASVSDQRIIGPPLVRRLRFAADKILCFDLSTKELLAPVTVTFAPAVKSLDAPVAVSATDPEELIAPVGETTPAVIVVPPPLEVSVPVPE